MKFRLIDELNIATTQGHTNRFDDDSYVGIMYYVSAKEDSSVIEETVMGNVRVNYNGDDIVNAPHSVLRKYTDLLYGKPKSSTGGAGENSYYGAFIPFYHPSLPNAIHKESEENLDFYIDKAQETVDEAICYVYGVIDDLEELYVPRLVALSETAGTGTKKILITMPNIADIMLTAPSIADPTLIQLLIDNDLVFSGSWQILEDFTNITARIEQTALDVILLDMVQKGQINEILSDEATLLITGGSGSYYYLVHSLKFNPRKTIKSAQRVYTKKNYRIANKLHNLGAQVSIIRNPVDKSPELVSQIQKTVAGI